VLVFSGLYFLAALFASPYFSPPLERKPFGRLIQIAVCVMLDADRRENVQKINTDIR